MGSDQIDLAAWLQTEDDATRSYRLERLGFLVNEFGSVGAGPMCFHGGELSKRCFEEARWSWVNGQFIACTIICQCFVEISLRSLLSARGLNVGASDYWLERTGMYELTKKARKIGLLTEDEVSALNRLRKNRIQYIHARPIFSKNHFMRRVLSTGETPEDTCEHDAQEAIRLTIQLARRFGEMV